MHRDDRGFTLIELLVAMTLMALLATIVTRALGSTNLAVGRGEERVAGMVAALDLQQLLVREVGRARPYVPDRAGRPVPIFEAEPERLRFIGINPEGRQPPPFVLVELTVEDVAGKKRLLLRKVPITGEVSEAESALATTAPVVLQEGGSYRLRYYGIAVENAGPAWVDTWPPDAPDIPQGLSLQVHGEAGTAASAVSEIVAPFPVVGAAICGSDKVECRLLPEDGR